MATWGAFSVAVTGSWVYSKSMTKTSTPAFIADATQGTEITYMVQSVDFSSGQPVVTDRIVRTVVASIERRSNGNSPMIVWTDADGEVHRNRPDFHIVILPVEETEMIWDAEPTAQAAPCRTALLTRGPETVWIHAYAGTSTVVLHYPSVVVNGITADGVVREIGTAPRSLATRFLDELDRHEREGWTWREAGVWSGDPWDVPFVAAGTGPIPF